MDEEIKKIQAYSSLCASNRLTNLLIAAVILLKGFSHPYILMTLIPVISSFITLILLSVNFAAFSLENETLIELYMQRYEYFYYL